MNLFIDFSTPLSKKNTNTKILDIKIPWVEKYRPKTSNEILLDPFIKIKIRILILFILKSIKYFQKNINYCYI